MLLKIKNLLTAEECARLVALAGELKFVDGRASNPANTSKQNLQADPADPKYLESVQIVGNAMARSREFGSFAIPKRIAPPLLCRYEPGMKYGAHADAAIIQLPNAKIRSDLSCTVFIGDPAAYEGGELAMVLGNQTLAFKGDAGRGGRLSLDAAARGRARALGPAARLDHLHREPRRRPARAHAGLRARMKLRRSRGCA